MPIPQLLTFYLIRMEVDTEEGEIKDVTVPVRNEAPVTEVKKRRRKKERKPRRKLFLIIRFMTS